MPQGRCTPLEVEEAEYVQNCYERAKEYGLVYEWLSFFAGGIRQGLDVRTAAEDACLEWDV